MKQEIRNMCRRNSHLNKHINKKYFFDGFRPPEDPDPAKKKWQITNNQNRGGRKWQGLQRLKVFRI